MGGESVGAVVAGRHAKASRSYHRRHGGRARRHAGDIQGRRRQPGRRGPWRAGQRSGGGGSGYSRPGHPDPRRRRVGDSAYSHRCWRQPVGEGGRGPKARAPAGARRGWLAGCYRPQRRGGGGDAARGLALVGGPRRRDRRQRPGARERTSGRAEPAVANPDLRRASRPDQPCGARLDREPGPGARGPPKRRQGQAGPSGAFPPRRSDP